MRSPDGAGRRPPDGAGRRPPIPPLAAIIAGFKSACTSRSRRLLGDPDARLWQRGYYEHTVRGPDQIRRMRRYIALNPIRWWRSHPH